MPGASGARNTTRQTASTGTLMLVVLGDDAVPAFPLHAPNLLVGRSPDNDIVLGETSVSARHARIDLRGGQVFLTDLGSTNGTFVAGRRVTGSVELQPGDTVALGRCLVRLEGSPAVAARPIHQPERAPDPVVDPVPVAVPGPQPVGAPESLLGAAWLAALQRAVEAPQVPARRPLRLLISADQADQDAARLLAQWLSRLGHQVRRPPSQTGNTPGSPRPTKGTGRAPNGAAGRAEPVDGQPDPWAGRLLEAMWGTDVVLFLVSDAATTSPRVHREVHLAGAERTTVMPVVVHPAVLPEDLSYYLQRVAPVELQHDPAAGLAVLQSRLDRCQPKRLARPWQLIRRLVSVGLVIAMVVLVVAFLAW